MWEPTPEERAELGQLGDALIDSIIAVTQHAQSARKFLTLEQLDKIGPDLLELEKASRNARVTLAAITTYVERRTCNLQ
jgi:hypothetical protein